MLILKKLVASSYKLDAIITTPDKPAGRGLVLTAPPVKKYTQENLPNTPLLQPENLKTFKLDCDLAIVASYGKILPKELIDQSKYGFLNVHPSLLPKYRGATPIQSVILNGDEETGVTIMLIDEKMDHGPIIAQDKKQKVQNKSFKELERELAEVGGDLLVQTLPRWLNGKVKPQEQEHEKATYTKLIKKEDGLIDPNGDPVLNWRKFRAYTPWPGIYFFDQNGKRVKITQAEFIDGQFKILKVIPEGRWEQSYL